MKRLLLAVPVLLLAGCTMGPDYVRPPVPTPGQYREDFPTQESIANTAWWELFGDPVLVELIETSLEDNRGLRATAARIAEARANLGIVRSDLFPRLDYSLSGAYEGTLGDDGQTFDSVTGLLSAGWQLDLWGRIRRSNEAALQGVLATEEAYRGLTIMLVAAIAHA
jgi:multidrug efflux system outer membrane protein